MIVPNNKIQYKTDYDNYSDYKAIMISTDRMIFNERSAVRKRMIEYSKSYKELHIIIFSKKTLKNPSEIKISDNCYVYSTDSITRFSYINNAFKIGKKILKSFDINEKVLITCQDPFETGLAGRKIASLRQNTHLLLQIHTDLFSPYFTKHSILNRIRLSIARNTLRDAQTVRVVSRKIADSLVLRGIPADDIVLKPIEIANYSNDLNPSFNLRDKYKEFKKIILIVSRLESEKNIDMAIRAFSIVNKTSKDTALVIVGSGSKMNSLKKMSRKFGLENCVKFEGWQNDTFSYYKVADIVLVTSWYEGYGMVLKEAAQLGKKIISTDVGIAQDIGAEIVDWNEKDISRALLNNLN